MWRSTILAWKKVCEKMMGRTLYFQVPGFHFSSFHFSISTFKFLYFHFQVSRFPFFHFPCLPSIFFISMFKFPGFHIFSFHFPFLLSNVYISISSFQVSIFLVSTFHFHFQISSFPRFYISSFNCLLPCSSLHVWSLTEVFFFELFEL